MRLPETFCFQLAKEELLNLRSHFMTSSLKKELNHGGTRYLPYVLLNKIESNTIINRILNELEI